MLNETFFLQFIQNNFDSGINVSPGTTVLMFFLNPTEFSVFIVLNGSSEIFIREGSNLFNSDDSNIVSLALFSVSEDIPINLTTANDDLLNLVVSNEFLSFRNNVLEKVVAVGEVLNVRASGLVSEELLGSESDQRLSEFSMHLSTESVEVVCRERAVNNLPVNLSSLTSLSGLRVSDSRLDIVITILEESFHSS